MPKNTSCVNTRNKLWDSVNDHCVGRFANDASRVVAQNIRAQKSSAKKLQWLTRDGLPPHLLDQIFDSEHSLLKRILENDAADAKD